MLLLLEHACRPTSRLRDPHPERAAVAVVAIVGRPTVLSRRNSIPRGPPDSFIPQDERFEISEASVVGKPRRTRPRGLPGVLRNRRRCALTQTSGHETRKVV